MWQREEPSRKEPKNLCSSWELHSVSFTNSMNGGEESIENCPNGALTGDAERNTIQVIPLNTAEVHLDFYDGAAAKEILSVERLHFPSS